MKTTKFVVISLLALIGLSNYTNAQSFEIPTGPFLDSTNYMPPPALKNLKGIINIIHYKQCGQSWSNNNLGTCTNSICVSGCAMTDATILLNANGVNVDPGQLNTWLKNNNGYANGCDLYWSAVTNYPGATLSYYASAAYSLSTLKSEIDGGNPVIVKVDHRYGGTGTCNHFVVVYGYNNTGNSKSDFLVSDPGTTTCPTGCNLSYYTICSETYPLRIYHNVTPGGGCAIANITPTPVSPGSSSGPGTSISTLTPTLTWNAVSGATNYDVYVSIYPYGSSNIIYQQTCVTGNSIIVPSGYLTNGNKYRWNLQANVSCGSCVSLNSAPLYFQTTICNPVNITTQPTNQTATVGGTATFTLSVNGTPPFSYFWYKNGAFVTSTTNTTSTSNSYITPTLTISDNGNYYYCLIINCNNLSQAQSNNANLTVNPLCTSPGTQAKIGRAHV